MYDNIDDSYPSLYVYNLDSFKTDQLKFNFLLLSIESKVWTFKITLYSTMIHVLPAK